MCAGAHWFAVARQPNVCCDDRPVLKRDSLSEVMFERHHMFVFCAVMTLLSSGELFARYFNKIAVVVRLNFMNVIEFCVGMYIFLISHSKAFLNL